MSDFRENLKPGDKVIETSRYHQTVRTVANVTKQHIILEGSATKWRIKGYGYVGRGRWDFGALVEATPEALAEIERVARRGTLEHRFRALKTDQMSDETLEAVLAAAEASRD